jgi:hypothetical protein
MPKGPGRKTKLTAALQQAIVNAVAAGVSLACAAELAGISPLSVKEWIQRGKGEDPDRPPTPLYTSFSQAVIRAKAQDETRRVARINQAGQGGAVIYRKTTTMADGRIITEERLAPPDWQADAWHLERSKPEDWGRKDRVDIRFQIHQTAAKVADELGLTVEEVLAEAQTFLAESTRAHGDSR